MGIPERIGIYDSAAKFLAFRRKLAAFKTASPLSLTGTMQLDVVPRTGKAGGSGVKRTFCRRIFGHLSVTNSNCIAVGSRRWKSLQIGNLDQTKLNRSGTQEGRLRLMFRPFCNVAFRQFVAMRGAPLYLT